jgi:hypothetical protein
MAGDARLRILPQAANFYLNLFSDGKNGAILSGFFRDFHYRDQIRMGMMT